MAAEIDRMDRVRMVRMRTHLRSAGKSVAACCRSDASDRCEHASLNLGGLARTRTRAHHADSETILIECTKSSI